MVVLIPKQYTQWTEFARWTWWTAASTAAVLMGASVGDAQWWQSNPSVPQTQHVAGVPTRVPGGPTTVRPFAGPGSVGGSAPYYATPAATPPGFAPGSVANPFAVAPAAGNVVSPVDRLLAQATEHERNGNAYLAIEAYREALQLDPRHHNALLCYARMKHRAEDFDGAIILYGQILKYYPHNPIALNDLGLCFARKGDTAQAIDALSRAVQQRPDSQRYRNNLAVVLVGAGRHREAYDVLAAGGGPAAANYNLAWMLNRQGKQNEAVPYVHAALVSDPSFQPAIALLAELESTTPYVAALPYDQASTSDGGTAEPVIQLRSGTVEVGGDRQIRTAEWDGPVSNCPQPPRVEDYAIPGFGLPSP